MNAPTACPPLDNALKSAKEIGMFLFKRSGYNLNILPEDYNREDIRKIYWGEGYQVITFIRLCHALGCDVLIRQKGSDDIEEP